MDETVHVVLGNSFGDALSTVHVHINVGEVPGFHPSVFMRIGDHIQPNALHNSLGRVLATNEVVHNIRVTDALLDGLRVAEIVFL